MDRVEELLQHICSALDTLNENIEGMKRMSEEDKEMLDSIKGRWLSQKEVAEMLGKCSASIKKMRDNGKIRGSLQGGRTYKYRLSEVLRIKNSIN